MHDLVIRGGTIIDGTGGARFTGDVAIDNGVITAIGTVSGKGKKEIDAKGLLVTPGFVDVHTHYDAQVSWDSLVSPSCWHGVTTVVMGNCAVGFAPTRPDMHQQMIELMEGGRGYSGCGACRRHRFRLGKFSRIYGCGGSHSPCRGYWRTASACGAARLCDG